MPPPTMPTPMLNSCTIALFCVASWVATTPMDQAASASAGPTVQSRNIRMQASKPTSMPPSPLSSTIGNRATPTISGTASARSRVWRSSGSAPTTSETEATSSATPSANTPRSNQLLRELSNAAKREAKEISGSCRDASLSVTPGRERAVFH